MQLVNYRIYGESNLKTIYILHGIFGMLDNWHLAAQQLSAQYRVVTFDARNHGKSFHDADSSFRAMATDLYNLIHHLGDGNNTSIIMGHSMGGKTAMFFAEHHSELVEKLIVVDIAPKQYVPGHLSYFKAFREVDLSQMNSRREVEEAFAPYAPEMGVRQFLLKNIEPQPDGGYKTKSNLEAIEHWYPTIIDRLDFMYVFNKPTYFIAGSKSGYIKEEDKPYILQHFPHSKFYVVENAGHWVHAENPQGFLEAVQNALQN